MFYWCIWATFYGGIGYLFEELNPWSFTDVLLLLALFIELVIIHICIYNMNFLEKRLSIITILLNLQIVWSFIISWYYFGEKIYIVNIFGAIIVVICGAIIMNDKEKISKENKN